VPRLAAGMSILATLTISGAPQARPGFVVVKAKGTTDTGAVTSLVTAELVASEAAASLTLVGNTRITDKSPADLEAVLTNLSEAPLKARLRAEAGDHDVRLAAKSGDLSKATANAQLSVDVPPRGAAVVAVRVEANHRVRRGKTPVVIIATIPDAQGQGSTDLTASRELDVALSTTDLLPDPLGITTVLAIPGLLAIWAWLAVAAWDRRRLGLEVSSPAKEMWDNKLWLLAAAGVSFVAAYLYSLTGQADLLDAYSLGDIIVVSLVAGLAGAGLSYLAVLLYRARVPLVTTTTPELEVLKAASRKDARGQRRTYTTDGKIGLFVHRDRGALVLTPPIAYSRPDGVDHNNLQAAAVKAAESDDFDGYYLSADNYIGAPTTAVDAKPAGSGREFILRYVMPPSSNP
jgi:hypothetical protein